MMTQKKENGDTVDDFIDWMKNEWWWKLVKKISHLNYIIWISIQIPHADLWVQNQRTTSLDLVFQKPLKTSGFHKRIGNKLVDLMVDYLIFFFFGGTVVMHQRTGYVIFWEPWLWILRTLPWYNHQGSVSNNRPTLATKAMCASLRLGLKACYNLPVVKGCTQLQILRPRLPPTSLANPKP
jgi:hypothetical protein